ncbi:tRNA (guanosine(46)-N7)-methyltransferase TrmB [Balneolales bacterium ANBcel1]|nr:tRNA (guanosine(46)-N7)-methyltransferase TrmB [Balneolales bacterium ANBcel1]
MARTTKLDRYDEILTLPNVTELHHYFDGDHASVRGKWASVFGNANPVTLELACGKGDYALALGRRYPDRNFIGIDIKGDRLWKGASDAIEAGLTNIHFVRARIDHLCNYFAPGDVEEIWITFPDPYEKKKKIRKRLTHPVFLQRYAGILKPSGIIHLKTDSDLLFAFTRKIIDIYGLNVTGCIDNLYALPSLPDELSIQTYYERKHLEKGLSIKYLSFRLDGIREFPDHPALNDLE